MFIHIFEIVSSVVWIAKIFCKNKGKLSIFLLYSTAVRNFISTVMYITVLILAIWESKRVKDSTIDQLDNKE